MSTLRDAATGPLAAELPARFMEEHALLPLRVDTDGAVVLACGREADPLILDEVARRFARPVRCEVAPLNEIQEALLSAQSVRAPAAVESDEGSLGDLRAQANDGPVVQLVNGLLADALQRGASDVHLESTTDGLRARFRLDGVLRDIATYPARLRQGALSRVKLLSGLDIAERRVPQDGRARLKLGAREVDLRVSTLPTLHGESAVLRILDQAGGARTLAALGLSHGAGARFESLLTRPSGLILVTGPTGSGKTTTLYAALQHLSTPDVKIVTVEDPVEYQLPGVTQMQVNRKSGLTFSAALRALLRHDPDIVMVGEMRDRETAEIAIRAALTGHLVFSTLHTNDAPSGVTRLVDMGIEPYLVAATLQGILAQRLVRTRCQACRGEARVEPCSSCGSSGYRGRTGIYELFVPDDAARAMVAAGASVDTLRARARELGMQSLEESAQELVASGITTNDEALRVTRGTHAAA